MKGEKNTVGQFLKIQRQMFRDASKELSREEYNRLIKTAREKGKDRLALLLETIGGTGIRVSEIRHIAVEAVRQSRADILGHSSIETTRIYLLVTGSEYRKQLNRLGLIL